MTPDQPQDDRRPRGEKKKLEHPRERDPGMLTYSQREYLYDPDSVADSSVPMKRQRIRDRVRNALLDFNYLKALQPKDRKLIFSKFDSDTERRLAVDTVLRFIYMGVREEGSIDFESALEMVVFTAESALDHRQGYEVKNVDVNIDVEKVHIPNQIEAYEKLERGDRLTDAELGLLARNIDEDKLKDLIDL